MVKIEWLNKYKVLRKIFVCAVQNAGFGIKLLGVTIRSSQHDINKPQRDGMQLYSSDEYYNLLSTWPTYKQTAVGAGLYLSLINDDADARDD